MKDTTIVLILGAYAIALVWFGVWWLVREKDAIALGLVCLAVYLFHCVWLLWAKH